MLAGAVVDLGYNDLLGGYAAAETFGTGTGQIWHSAMDRNPAARYLCTSSILISQHIEEPAPILLT